jgi:hypothetical protein
MNSYIANISNYSALANSCNRLLTIAHMKSFQFVFNSHRSVTVPNNSFRHHCLTANSLLQMSTLKLLKSKRQSHIPTDGQPAKPSWCQAPSATQDQILVTVKWLQFCPSLLRGRVCHLTRSKSAVHVIYMHIYNFTSRHSTMLTVRFLLDIYYWGIYMKSEVQYVQYEHT